MADARNRAERCFAVARSTDFESERANAIALGMRIAHDAGLSLDTFDIPGRRRASGAASSMPRPSLRLDPASDIAAAMRRLYEEMVMAAARADARPGETAYDAQRRNFDEQSAAAKARDRARRDARA